MLGTLIPSGQEHFLVPFSNPPLRANFTALITIDFYHSTVKLHCSVCPFYRFMHKHMLKPLEAHNAT